MSDGAGQHAAIKTRAPSAGARRPAGDAPLPSQLQPHLHGQAQRGGPHAPPAPPLVRHQRCAVVIAQPRRDVHPAARIHAYCGCAAARRVLAEQRACLHVAQPPGVVSVGACGSVGASRSDRPPKPALAGSATRPPHPGALTLVVGLARLQHRVLPLLPAVPPQHSNGGVRAVAEAQHHVIGARRHAAFVE